MKDSAIMVGRYEIHSWDFGGRRQVKDLEAVKNIKKDIKPHQAQRLVTGVL